MPFYDFECKGCKHRYEAFAKKAGKYTGIQCPECKSKKKTHLLSVPGYAFTNPIGTDRWTSDRGGHGYRFDFNKPAVKAQREIATQMSHMGADPYGAGQFDKDLELDVGIHDAETRQGLS